MTKTNIPGDWRSGAYGADRKAHLFVWFPLSSHKAPACGIRADSKYASPTVQRRASNLCRECVRFSEQYA